MNHDVVALFAVVFTLSIPIIAIIGWVSMELKKKQNECEIRKSIIENHVDAEMAKQLIAQTDKKKSVDIYGTFRAACVLLGLGLGYLVTFLLGFQNIDNVGFWIILACGVGVGLLISFFIQRQLEKKDRKSETQEE